MRSRSIILLAVLIISSLPLPASAQSSGQSHLAVAYVDDDQDGLIDRVAGVWSVTPPASGHYVPAAGLVSEEPDQACFENGHRHSCRWFLDREELPAQHITGSTQIDLSFRLPWDRMQTHDGPLWVVAMLTRWEPSPGYGGESVYAYASVRLSDLDVSAVDGPEARIVDWVETPLDHDGDGAMDEWRFSVDLEADATGMYEVELDLRNKSGVYLAYEWEQVYFEAPGTKTVSVYPYGDWLRRVDGEPFNVTMTVTRHEKAPHRGSWDLGNQTLTFGPYQTTGPAASPTWGLTDVVQTRNQTPAGVDWIGFEVFGDPLQCCDSVDVVLEWPGLDTWMDSMYYWAGPQSVNFTISSYLIHQLPDDGPWDVHVRLLDRHSTHIIAEQTLVVDGPRSAFVAPPATFSTVPHASSFEDTDGDGVFDEHVATFTLDIHHNDTFDMMVCPGHQSLWYCHYEGAVFTGLSADPGQMDFTFRLPTWGRSTNGSSLDYAVYLGTEVQDWYSSHFEPYAEAWFDGADPGAQSVLQQAFSTDPSSPVSTTPVDDDADGVHEWMRVDVPVTYHVTGWLDMELWLDSDQAWLEDDFGQDVRAGQTDVLSLYIASEEYERFEGDVSLFLDASMYDPSWLAGAGHMAWSGQSFGATLPAMATPSTPRVEIIDTSITQITGGLRYSVQVEVHETTDFDLDVAVHTITGGWDHDDWVSQDLGPGTYTLDVDIDDADLERGQADGIYWLSAALRYWKAPPAGWGSWVVGDFAKDLYAYTPAADEPPLTILRSEAVRFDHDGDGLYDEAFLELEIERDASIPAYLSWCSGWLGDDDRLGWEVCDWEYLKEGGTGTQTRTLRLEVDLDRSLDTVPYYHRAWLPILNPEGDMDTFVFEVEASRAGFPWETFVDGRYEVTMDGDMDRDGVWDSLDNCPDEPNQSQADLDSDGRGDLCDDDQDGDGVADAQDIADRDSKRASGKDLDGDGTDDEFDDDDDGDGKLDGSDNCPRHANAGQADLDGDGQGDACDQDDDGDGTLDDQDAFPTDPAESTDTDGDGIGDNADDDDDGDGYSDADEAIEGTDPKASTDIPQVPAAPSDVQVTFAGDHATVTWSKVDGGGYIVWRSSSPYVKVGSIEGSDTTSFVDDSIQDGIAYAYRVTAYSKTGIGDVDSPTGLAGFDEAPATDKQEAVLDQDGDGVRDSLDLAPTDPDVGADSDGDGIADALDNCPGVTNSGQTDADEDGQGDACDEVDDLQQATTSGTQAKGSGMPWYGFVAIALTGLIVIGLVVALVVITRRRTTRVDAAARGTGQDPPQPRSPYAPQTRPASGPPRPDPARPSPAAPRRRQG